MKIAIVSDTHDNINNFNKIIDFLNKEKINLILHCGDICNRQTIAEATNNFKGEIKFVRGNGDYDLDDIPEKMDIDFYGKKIAFVHYPDIAKKMAESQNYDFVFYGHTHKPWQEKIGKCFLVNPGEVAGQRFKPTFAIYNRETDILDLKILETI